MSNPRLELIVAMDGNMGIGKNNSLPWSLPTEWAYFLRMTQNPVEGKQHVAIFGRRNWESIPEEMRPWKNSICFVLSRTMKQSDVDRYPDVYICSDFQQIIHHLQNGTFRDQIDRIWVHGGRDIYAQAMRSSHFYRLYVTKIDAVYEADVFFPPVDWNKLNVVHDDQVPQGVQIDNGTQYSVFVYESKGPLIEA